MLKDQHPFWSAWTDLVIARPRAIIVCAVAIAATLAYAAFNTPRDLSFTGILDDGDVELPHFRETLDTFGQDSMLILLLEGERAEIDRSIDLLVAELPKRVSLQSVNPPGDADWLLDRAPWIWPRPLFDAVLREVESGKSPEGVGNTVAAMDETIRKVLRPVETAELVGISVDHNPLDMAMGGKDFYDIEEATEDILREGDCEVTHIYTGLVAWAAQDQRNVFTRIRILTPVTMIAILILLSMVEPRLSRVIMAGIALSFSVVISFGMTGLVLGRLSIVVTFFSLLLLGLGIDFGIHLLVALRDGRAHGKSPEETVRFGIRHTATAIALGGISTSLAFGMIALAPEPGMRDMGFSALFGLLSALVLMLTFLPATWLLLEKRHSSKDAPPRFRLPGLHAVVGFSLKYPRSVLLAGLALTVAGAASYPRYELESDLEKIISRSVTSFEAGLRLEELFDVSPNTYIAPVESLEQARSWAKELVAMDDIATVNSAADIILPDAEERWDLAESMLLALPEGHREGPLYERLRRASEVGLITVESIPDNLATGMRGKNGELAISIVPKESSMDAYVVSEQIERVRSVADTATGPAVIVRMAVIGSRDYIPIMIPAILSVVTLVLLVSFRSFRDTALALLPVVIGTAVSFGVFLWFGISMTLLTSIVVPVILGLGVDDGIHVVERLRQYHSRTDETIHEAVEGVGRAIFLTTATTCVSLVSLLFTNHMGLESLALFMLVGIPVCFVASVTALPAAAKLLAPRDQNPTKI